MFALTSLGGAGTVTGSKHLLTLDGHRILIDCGLFQGLKNLRELNWAPFPVDPRSIDAIVLTHAHLDHSGYLPKIVREGFRGRVFATDTTCNVAALILKDSGYIQEKDADYANRKSYSKHKPALPLYGVRDAERAVEAFTAVPYHKTVSLPGGATLTFRHAGHILGAATAEIGWGGKKILFSGDLGRYGDPVMVDPETVSKADYVVVESTYGNRSHDTADPVEQLGAVIEKTVARGGTVVIPAFAVGRAQSLLYYIWALKQAGRIRDVPVYLDSPMAINASELLCAHLDDHRLSPPLCKQVCDIATYVREVEDSKEITANAHPKIIISASGMATGGRVLHHMKSFAPDRKHTILFSGFQAAGTRGRAMLQGARETKIHGQWVPVRAEIAELPMLSAHADGDEIMRWLSALRRPPQQTFVVHGEPDASEALRVRIGRELGWHVAVPRQDQVFTL